MVSSAWVASVSDLPSEAKVWAMYASDVQIDEKPFGVGSVFLFCAFLWPFASTALFVDLQCRSSFPIHPLPIHFLCALCIYRAGFSFSCPSRWQSKWPRSAPLFFLYSHHALMFSFPLRL
eukprot:RCo006966